MPRKHRVFSYSNLYHIIIKGLDDGEIFYDNEDRQTFIEKIEYSKNKFTYDVYAYCLMSNHIHLVINVDSCNLSKAIQSLNIRYTKYFNNKYDRKGNLVQNRFFSKNIENQKYFLDVCRYVHRNPEKAGISKTYNYKWSSYSEYINSEKIINKKVLMHYLRNDVSVFVNYINKEESIDEMINIADFEMSSHITDNELVDIILKKYNLQEPCQIISYFKNRENKIKLKELKLVEGISQRQVARITRVNRETIRKIFSQ